MAEAPAPILVVTGPSGAGKTTVGALIAASFELSVHLPMDAFMPFVVNGWIEPWLPESAHQNYVLGGAVAAAAMQFAEGGYTVVLDGHLFPEGLDGLSPWCAGRDIPIHYAVLRPDLATCLGRVAQRRSGDREPSGHPEDHEDHEDPESIARLQARFAGLGDREANVFDATGTPDEVAAAVLAAFSSGRLAEVVRPLPNHGRQGGAAGRHLGPR